MTRKQNNAKELDWKALLAEQGDFLRPLAQAILRQVMEAVEKNKVVIARREEDGTVVEAAAEL